jgi:chromate transport protein ChrA
LKVIVISVNILIILASIVFGFTGFRADYSSKEQMVALLWGVGFACVGLVNILALSFFRDNRPGLCRTLVLLFNISLVFFSGLFCFFPIDGPSLLQFVVSLGVAVMTIWESVDNK